MDKLAKQRLFKKGSKMKLTQNLLFITYHLKEEINKLNVICKGCRVINILDYELPSYVKGMINYDGEYVSIIDPSVYFRGQQSMLGNLACILIIEYVYEYRNCKAGIIIEDIDEIMNLAAGNYENSDRSPTTFNMSFIIEALQKGQAEQFLSNTQNLLDMYEKRKNIRKKSLMRHCEDVIKAELVDKTEYGEFDFFDTNEFLVAI
jgi:chemotaxis signal transduction protein